MKEPGRQQPTEEHQLQGWSVLGRFVRVLEEVGPPVVPGSREAHGLRTLERRAYFGLFLLGLFNPVVSAVRGPHLPRVRALLVDHGGPVGVSRFSEAQQVFAPEVLQLVLARLLKESALRQVISAKFGRITPDVIRVVN